MTRREIHAETFIDAPPAQVWRLLTDFASYRDWNPFFREAAGELRAGATVRVRVEIPGQGTRVFTPRIVELTPERELTWIGRLVLPGLFDGEHGFLLDPVEGGRRTLLVQHENFSGLLLPLFTAEMEDATRRGFEAMSAALKREAERAMVSQ